MQQTDSSVRDQGDPLCHIHIKPSNISLHPEPGSSPGEWLLSPDIVLVQ